MSFHPLKTQIGVVCQSTAGERYEHVYIHGVAHGAKTFPRFPMDWIGISKIGFWASSGHDLVVGVSCEKHVLLLLKKCLYPFSRSRRICLYTDLSELRV